MTAPEEAKSEVEAAFVEWIDKTYHAEYEWKGPEKFTARSAFAAGAEFGMNETVKLINEGNRYE